MYESCICNRQNMYLIVPKPSSQSRARCEHCIAANRQGLRLGPLLAASCRRPHPHGEPSEAHFAALRVMPSDKFWVWRIESGSKMVCGDELSVKITHSGLRVEHMNVVT